MLVPLFLVVNTFVNFSCGCFVLFPTSVGMVVKYAAGTNPKMPPRIIAPTPDNNAIMTSRKFCSFSFLNKTAKDKTKEKIIPKYPPASVDFSKFSTRDREGLEGKTKTPLNALRLW